MMRVGPALGALQCAVLLCVQRVLLCIFRWCEDGNCEAPLRAGLQGTFVVGGGGGGRG